MRPVLDYGTSVWDPLGVVLQEELESVQKRAARFVTGNYNYETGSMTGILGQLKWVSLKKRMKYNRLILLYKGLKGKASVPTDDLIPKSALYGGCQSFRTRSFRTQVISYLLWSFRTYLLVISYPVITISYPGHFIPILVISYLGQLGTK